MNEPSAVKCGHGNWRHPDCQVCFPPVCESCGYTLNVNCPACCNGIGKQPAPVKCEACDEVPIAGRCRCQPLKTAVEPSTETGEDEKRLRDLEDRLALWCQIREPSPLVKHSSVKEMLVESRDRVRELLAARLELARLTRDKDAGDPQVDTSYTGQIVTLQATLSQRDAEIAAQAKEIGEMREQLDSAEMLVRHLHDMFAIGSHPASHYRVKTWLATKAAIAGEKLAGEGK